MRAAWHPVLAPDAPCPSCTVPVATDDFKVNEVLVLRTYCRGCGWNETMLAELTPA